MKPLPWLVLHGEALWSFGLVLFVVLGLFAVRARIRGRAAAAARRVRAALGEPSGPREIRAGDAITLRGELVRLGPEGAPEEPPTTRELLGAARLRALGQSETLGLRMGGDFVRLRGPLDLAVGSEEEHRALWIPHLGRGPKTLVLRRISLGEVVRLRGRAEPCEARSDEAGSARYRDPSVRYRLVPPPASGRDVGAITIAAERGPRVLGPGPAGAFYGALAGLAVFVVAFVLAPELALGLAHRQGSPVARRLALASFTQVSPLWTCRVNGRNLRIDLLAQGIASDPARVAELASLETREAGSCASTARAALFSASHFELGERLAGECGGSAGIRARARARLVRGDFAGALADTRAALPASPRPQVDLVGQRFSFVSETPGQTERKNRVVDAFAAAFSGDFAALAPRARALASEIVSEAQPNPHLRDRAARAKRALSCLADYADVKSDAASVAPPAEGSLCAILAADLLPEAARKALLGGNIDPEGAPHVLLTMRFAEGVTLQGNHFPYGEDFARVASHGPIYTRLHAPAVTRDAIAKVGAIRDRTPEQRMGRAVLLGHDAEFRAATHDPEGARAALEEAEAEAKAAGATGEKLATTLRLLRAAIALYFGRAQEAREDLDGLPPSDEKGALLALAASPRPIAKNAEAVLLDDGRVGSSIRLAYASLPGAGHEQLDPFRLAGAWTEGARLAREAGRLDLAGEREARARRIGEALAHPDRSLALFVLALASERTRF